MKPRKVTTTIIVHGAWTPPNMDIGVADIRQWHLERDFSDIGYHFVIRRDGTIEEGRALDKVGAHCKGLNATSIGICLVGGRPGDNHPDRSSDRAWDFNYTAIQMASLMVLVDQLAVKFKDIHRVMGHRDALGVTKLCPGFDVAEWFRHVGV